MSSFTELADGYLVKRVCEVDIDTLKNSIETEVENIISEIEKSVSKEER